MILGRDSDPQLLIDKLRFACQTMVEELLSYGLLPNFKEGRTEAVVDPRGKGSTQLRRKIFTDRKSLLPMETNLPDQPSLRLVPRYKHRGGLITPNFGLSRPAERKKDYLGVYLSTIFSHFQVSLCWTTTNMLTNLTTISTVPSKIQGKFHGAIPSNRSVTSLKEGAKFCVQLATLSWYRDDTGMFATVPWSFKYLN